MLKTSRAIILAIFLTLLTGFYASSQEIPPSGGTQQEQPQTSKSDQPRGNQSQNAATPPIIVYVQPPTKSEAEAEQDRHERQGKADLDKRLVDLTAELSEYTGGLYRATVVLAIATIGLLIATFGSVIFAFFQSRDMKASIAISEKAANAAKTSSESLPIIESAYVYPNIISVNIGDRFDAFAKSEARNTSKLLVEYEFRNFGKTPAIIQGLAAELSHRDPRRTSGVGLGMAPVNNAVLGPSQGTGTTPAEINDFSRAEWETAKAEKTFIHFFGSVDYSDIFGDTWSFSFDWKYSPRLGRLIPDNQKRRKTT